MNSTSQSTDIGGLVIIVSYALIAGLIYIAPTIVAFVRKHPNRWLILVIDVAFGGTVIGWGIALVWALRSVHRVGSAGSGGESGLNLFINDVKKVQFVEPPPLPRASPVEELERLHALLVRGIISQGEFDGLKARLLGGATAA